MKFICLNCNGIRAASSKGLKAFIEKENADIVAFQEIKATEKEIEMDFWKGLGYFPFVFSAEKKGYSGTAVFSKLQPKNTTFGLGHKLFDSEGRNIILEFGDFTFINTYFPSGTSGEDRQKIKMEFLGYYEKKFIEWKKKFGKLIICGDVNIAHEEIDIHNPKGNSKNSGFLPEEREWLTAFLSNGLLDTFRHLHPGAKDEYSWWTYRFQARANNKGWRIDYFFITKNLEKNLKSSRIDQSLVISDHAPLILEIDLP